MKVISHHYQKPLWGSMIFLSEGKLKTAVRKDAKIECVGKLGTFLIEPKEWLETGQLMEKVFRRPSEPMRLRGKALVKKQEKVATLF